MKSLLLLTAAVTLLSAAPLYSADKAADVPLEKCVVNGESFAEHHNPPIEVEANGKKMFVCCRGCQRKFKRDPEKYLKLWDAALKAKTAGN